MTIRWKSIEYHANDYLEDHHDQEDDDEHNKVERKNSKHERDCDEEDDKHEVDGLGQGASW